MIDRDCKIENGVFVPNFFTTIGQCILVINYFQYFSLILKMVCYSSYQKPHF